jgi:hypothetical protein
MTKPRKYYGRNLLKSYSEEYSAIWYTEVPLIEDRTEFMNADSKRRNEVMQVYSIMYRESIDPVSVPWGI